MLNYLVPDEWGAVGICEDLAVGIGCKDKDFYFKPPNYFGTFFLKVCFIILYRRSLSNAGAKVVL